MLKQNNYLNKKCVECGAYRKVNLSSINYYECLGLIDEECVGVGNMNIDLNKQRLYAEYQTL